MILQKFISCRRMQLGQFALLVLALPGYKSHLLPAKAELFVVEFHFRK